MRKFLVFALVSIFVANGVASAHQPIVLLETENTAATGPLIMDGTVSYAVRASFSKAGQRKAFRAQFKSGDAISIQYLIVDRKPESGLSSKALPTVVITGPSGESSTMALKERTRFYEPYSKVNYLYLSRYSAVAQEGIYSITLTSRGKAGITVAIGDREVAGTVLRSAPSPSTPSS